VITLERAIALAALAHEGQIDKAGAPYILHPIRVMQAQATNDARIVAVFHDVLEDCAGWSPERLLAEGFTSQLIEALEGVTKRREEKVDYQAFVRRAGRNAISRAVKIADLRDNLDISRLSALTTEDLARINKYKAALTLLEPDDDVR
jgi:(p)ppGpp synthase/HD superfamily hydrolase